MKVYVSHVPKPSGKHSLMFASLTARTHCHSTWSKRSQRTHSRTDSTNTGQIWAHESFCFWAHQQQVSSI